MKHTLEFLRRLAANNDRDWFNAHKDEYLQVSSDKTPYKTHIGIYVNPHGGKKSEFCGYYLHLQPDNCLVGGGAWFPEPSSPFPPPSPTVKSVREKPSKNSLNSSAF